MPSPANSTRSFTLLLLLWERPLRWPATEVSLGFVHATEERVAGHLRAHLKALPGEDRKSQLILQQMLTDEERHGEEALQHGGEEFPRPVKDAMTLASQLMTKTTYWI